MSVTEVNGENFDAEVIKSEVPVIVKFWASWCGPCKMMKPIYEKVSEEYEGKVKFADVSVETENDLAGKYQVRSIPCVVLFKGGAEVGRVVGFVAEDAIKEKIKEVFEL